ncbi:RNase adapter RapZ [Kitasatospora sp. NPDC004723]|uniref:RapZ C-terminal domain-containing protein n=1 Tax=Kitasatospora sp. NPDC004723 TaxID=3154288 RepID=UPI0033B9A9C0
MQPPTRAGRHRHAREGEPMIEITSFGELHGPAPTADIVARVKRHFRDPHMTDDLRDLTGADAEIVETVLGTAGIPDLITSLVDAVHAYGSGPSAADKTITVAVGCSGGRHRAHVVASELARRLIGEGLDVTLHHRDAHRDVVDRDAETGEALPTAATAEDPQALAAEAAALFARLGDFIRADGDQYAAVRALKEAAVPAAFAAVLTAASGQVDGQMTDPYDADDRLASENLYSAAGQIVEAFRWL